MLMMANWTFLTNHARVLLCIAHDPGVRLRDIAASLGITERSAYGIVTDLAEAGYMVKQKTGRRNRYQIQAHLPLPEPSQPRTHRRRRPGPSRRHRRGAVTAGCLSGSKSRPACHQPNPVSSGTPGRRAPPGEDLYRFKTHRMASDLGIHEISYAAW